MYERCPSGGCKAGPKESSNGTLKKQNKINNYPDSNNELILKILY